MRKRDNSGLSNAATDPVSLKVLSWNVAGLAENCADIFLSQISMLTDWDVLLLQECFRKLDGVDVGVHELFTPSELLGGLRCPAVIVNRKWKGQSKIVGGAARWTAVELGGQLTFISAHFATQRKEIGRIRSSFDGNPGIREWEDQTTCDLGRGLQCEPVWYDRLFPCWGVDPKTENDDRHKRFVACESFAHDGNRTGFDGDKHVDECRHRTRAFHAFQLVKPRRLVDTNGLHHDFEKIGNETCAGARLRLVQDRSQSGVCSSFVETENEVHGEDGRKLAWLDARRLLASCGCSIIDRLGELEQGGTFACGNCESSQKGGIQGDVRDRNGAQNTSVEKEDRRSVPRTNRTEEKEKCTEKRETPGQDQGECRAGESPQKNAEQAFQLEINCEGRKSQVCSHKILPRPIFNLRRTGEVNPIRETTLGGAVEKHENRLCWWNVDLAKETGKCHGETEKRERLAGSNHSRCVESFAPRMFGKDGEVAVADVLEHGFSGRLAVFVDGDGSESGGCNVLDQVQTYCWTMCDAKSLGLRLDQVTTSTEIRKCANCVCAGNTCRCWSVSAAEGGRTVSRVAERDCSGTTGREEGVRPCGPSSGLQGNEIARSELVLDGIDCGNLEWKLHEGMLGNSDIKQSSDEPRIASGSAGIPSHLHDDHGIGAARLDKELDFTETGLEIGRLHAGCDLLCGRCGADCCVGVCCRNNGVRGDRKTEKCWIDSRCTKNTLDESPEDGRQEHHGGWIGCDVGGSSRVYGIDGVFRWECKTCNRAQNSSSQQMPCKMETCVEFSLAPQIATFEHRKNYDVAGFSMELECLDDGQGTERQNCELERENGGKCCWSEKTAWNGDGTVVETLAQDWSSLDREMQYECTGGHPRSYAQLGWTCGKDGLQRYLCQGSEMSRLTMVEMETDNKLERGGKRQIVWSAPTTVQNLQMGGHGCWGGLQICWECGWSVGNCSRQHGLVASCSKSRKLEAVCEMWKEPCIDGPGCLGDPSASGMTGTNAVVAWLTRDRMEREKFGEHLPPFSRFQANWNITVVLSWCCAGYGLLGSYGSWYGRRRDRWNGKSEIHSDVEWFCLTGATKVLSWNVAHYKMRANLDGGFGDGLDDD